MSALLTPDGLPFRAIPGYCAGHPHEGCGRRFRASRDFDRHRTGDYAPATRRCLTDDELTALGWDCRDGLWTSPQALQDAARARGRGGSRPETPEASTPYPSPTPARTGADRGEAASTGPIVDPGTWLALLTEQANPSAGHIRVLGRFAEYADADGVAAPSLYELARDLGVRLETVRHAVVGTALMGGWLVKLREADPSHGRPATYRLAVPHALERAA